MLVAQRVYTNQNCSYFQTIKFPNYIINKQINIYIYLSHDIRMPHLIILQSQKQNQTMLLLHKRSSPPKKENTFITTFVGICFSIFYGLPDSKLSQVWKITMYPQLLDFRISGWCPICFPFNPIGYLLWYSHSLNGNLLLVISLIWHELPYPIVL